MKIHDEKILPLFSTPIYLGNASYYINDVIDLDNINFDEFYGEKFDSNLGDYGRVLISKNQNILTDERFSVIKDYCDSAMHSYAYENILIPPEIKLKLTCSWMVVGYPGAITGKHLHQNSIFSGVFYLKSDSNSGDLLLSHPLTIPTCFSSTVHPSLKEYNILNSKIYVHTPKDNDIILFPGHLPHEVTRNNSGKLRCCIAFNYFFDGLVSDMNTERLSLTID